ncbi:MAG: thioredoxin domain-containing protein [Bacteroidetes bacterium]|nr:thioredoxin domain-containing protein [Bacteroidota bacterium]
MTKELTSENFNEVVLNAKTPVLVDFYSKDGCGWCEIISPVIAQISDDFVNKVIVAKIDANKFMDKAIEFGIRSVPTLLFFMDGKVVFTKKGFNDNSKREIKIILDKLLAESMNPVL